MSAAKAIRLLTVEDRPEDAALIVEEFERAGYQVETERVASALGLEQELIKPWDVITCDHVMPKFSSREALEIVQKKEIDIPFLLVSGSIGDRGAAEMMRLGVHDYILKSEMELLVVSAERALKEAGNRRDKKAAIERLVVSEVQFRTMFEVATVGVVEALLETGQILTSNRKMCQLNQRTEAEMLERTIFDLCIPEDIPKQKETIEKLLRSEAESNTAEKRFLTQSGEIWWGIEAASVIRDKDGKPYKGLFVIIDISHQKSLEESQSAAIEARNRFLSIASHELRTPMMSLKLQVQIYKRALEKGDVAIATPEKILPLLRDMDKQIITLNRLVDEMLDVTRVTTGNLILRPKACDLCELVSSTVDRLRLQVEVTGSKLVFHKCKQILGEWDPDRLMQVLTNLLTNAARYGMGREIEVRTWQKDSVVQFSVRDNGLGIAKEDQPRIFQQFERAVKDNDISGLGLGLFISQKIVEAHGGTISLESTLGVGSTFTVALPRVVVGEAVNG